MSRNQSRNQSPVKIIVADSLYEILAERRADRNAKLAADGLPPAEDDFPFITKEQAEAQAEAEAKQSTAQKTAANLAPPPPARGPLCRAAKAKVAERNAAIPGFERHSRKCTRVPLFCASRFYSALLESRVRSIGH